MKCEACEHWIVRKETAYGGGEVIVNWTPPIGKGECQSLGILTEASFGCNRFIETASDHVAVTHKDGEPWQHFVMIPCPDCKGVGDGGRGHRCAGTGLVRLYDDGHIGDEQTRRHPKEVPLPTTCPSCAKPVEQSWSHCPSCGGKLWKTAETEVIDDVLPPAPEATT